jgi:hypothetical protein
VIYQEYGGQGLAGKLATVALDETVVVGLTIVPVCPYIKEFLTKHAENAGQHHGHHACGPGIPERRTDTTRPGLGRVAKPFKG